MTQAAFNYLPQLKRERPMERYIPFSSHINDRVIKLRSGDYMCVWRLEGLSHESEDPADIQLKMDGLNQLYRSVASENVAIWTHHVRKSISDRLTAEFKNDFCAHLNEKYYGTFTGVRMMANELYLTVIYRPIVSRLEKTVARRTKRTIEDVRRAEKEALKQLSEISNVVEQALRRYGIEILETYKNKNGVMFSSALELMAALINGEWQKVPVPSGPLYEYLGTSRLFFGSETLEIRGSSGKSRFAAGIDFKDYPAHSEPGLLDTLLYEDYEYILTQSCSFMSRPDALDFLDRQSKQMQNAEDAAVSQIEEMEAAKDLLMAGDFAMGEYSATMFVFADDLQGLNRNVAAARATLADTGILPARIDIALEAAWWSQLPGNWKYRPRLAKLTSLNVSALESFHNFASGKRDGNPWGQAVTMLKTPSRQPYYFNFHSSKVDEDVTDKKLLGNTKIIGQSGAGKTVLLSMLLCQAQKFNPTIAFFDKDHGGEILIRALQGKYLTFENGKRTGLNPFQLEAEETNIQMLESIVSKLASDQGRRPLKVDDEGQISHAVRTVMRMPKELRRLGTVRQNINDTGDESVYKRLAKWCDDGALAWVLDNPADELDLTTHRIYGFDGTAFLDNAEVRTPISMYLLHRMESMIDGNPFMYFMDEFWKWLLDEHFSNFAFNKQKTIRKQNGLGVFATQSAVDVLASPIARAIIEQCATDIYLPNPKADRKEYMEGFKISEAEFNLVKNLGEDSRMFLVKQGHSSTVAALDLKGFDDEMVVLSGSLDNIELLNDIRAQVGDDPQAWLPILQKQVRERGTKIKK